MTAPVDGASAGSTALSEADTARRQEDVTTIDTLLLDCRDAALWRELRRVRAHVMAELLAGHELPPTPDTGTQYDFTIVPRADEHDGGWTLRLIEDGEEVGGRVYPLVVDEAAGAVWWDALSEAERRLWLRRAVMPTAADAYAHYLLDVGWRAASEAAGIWLDSRLRT